MQVWLRGPPRGVKVLELLALWNPDGLSACKFTMKIEVGLLAGPPGPPRGVKVVEFSSFGALTAILIVSLR